MEERLGLRVLAIPLKIPTVPIYMIWHETRRNDAAQAPRCRRARRDKTVLVDIRLRHARRSRAEKACREGYPARGEVRAFSGRLPVSGIGASSSCLGV
jgi:hypothetical protein